MVPKSDSINECSFEGCAKAECMRGLCDGHRTQLRRYGKLKPLIDKGRGLDERIRERTVVKDGCWDWTGKKFTNGYGSLTYRGRDLLAHRVVYELSNGLIPEGALIDHRCINPGCVNPKHLRLATQKQNSENLADHRSNNKSGFRGVHQIKRSGRWIGSVCHRYKNYRTPSFLTAEEAAVAVKELRLSLFTHNELDRQG